MSVQEEAEKAELNRTMTGDGWGWHLTQERLRELLQKHWWGEAGKFDELRTASL